MRAHTHVRIKSLINIDVVDRNNKIITRITHREFLEEKKIGFRNWKQNKKILYIDEDGKTTTIIEPFFTDKSMDVKWLAKLIKKCEKEWKGQPKHFLEIEKELIAKSKRKYKVNLKKIREEIAPLLEKYHYLVPILRLLNQDVFSSH